jgi:TPR repeat protein
MSSFAETYGNKLEIVDSALLNNVRTHFSYVEDDENMDIQNEFETKANQGNAIAMFIMGFIYELRYNYDLAFQWYKKALKSGCSSALEKYVNLEMKVNYSPRYQILANLMVSEEYVCIKADIKKFILEYTPDIEYFIPYYNTDSDAKEIVDGVVNKFSCISTISELYKSNAQAKFAFDYVFGCNMSPIVQMLDKKTCEVC